MVTKEPPEKDLILQEWNKWARENITAGKRVTGTDALAFYGHLQQAKPDLLKFKYPGDPWQQVNAWLTRAGRISD